MKVLEGFEAEVGIEGGLLLLEGQSLFGTRGQITNPQDVLHVPV